MKKSLKRRHSRTWVLLGLLAAACGLCPEFVTAAQIDEPSDRVELVESQITSFDPELPNYLFIGDSISLNYSKAIQDLHEGKLNVRRPPENCRSSGYGVSQLSKWLVDKNKPDQKWDVISFNFGHWDVSETKVRYQQNLRDIIGKLEQTGAQLVWVTTCPVPDGLESNDDSETPENSTIDSLESTLERSLERSPGRTPGAVKNYLNPWAAEVIDEFPEITICDQWQFVYEKRDGLYKDWWAGNDVHFSLGPAYGIGRLLAEHVLELTGKHRGPGWVRPPVLLKPHPSLRGQPVWKPNPYTGFKTGGFYSEEETAGHLRKRWKNAERLPDGFPQDFPITLSPSIPDYQGWAYDLVEVANHLQLKSIKQDIKNGHRLLWYPIPTSDRRCVGPGLTGDELLSDLKSGKFPGNHDWGEFGQNEFDQNVFINGFFYQNVSTLYDLYRITRDRYYSDQIVQYALAVQWILDHQPERLGRNETDEDLNADHWSVGSNGYASMDLLWAHVNASRLLLEQVRVDRAGSSDERVAIAKRLLKTTNQFLRPLMAENEGSSGPSLAVEDLADEESSRTGTRWLVQDRKVPGRVAAAIESEPWNRTLVILSVLTASVRAMEELEGIENTDAFEDSIGQYRRIVAAGIEHLQRENDCVVCDGVPYFFHSQNGRNDKALVFRIGHPMFEGESTKHLANNVWQLAYIWDSGDSFGCPTALVAGYTNSVVDFLEHPTGELNGRIYPRAHLDSPWYIAATGAIGESATNLGADLFVTAPFSPKIVQAHQLWSLRRSKNEELKFLRAATLYREWLRRKRRSGR